MFRTELKIRESSFEITAQEGTDTRRSLIPKCAPLQKAWVGPI